MSEPSSILFICGMNSIRSPMAEAIARNLLPNTIYIQSAGLRQGERDHFVDAALNEIKLDLGDRQPRIYNEMEDGFFDVIVTLTPEANAKAIEITKTTAADVIYWPMDDPTLVRGTREHILDAYRQLREALSAKIKGRFLR